MSDFFGYSRTGAAHAQIVSSEYAKITIGGQVSLVQSFQAAYQQELRPVFSVGDPNLYWVTGHPQGTITISRMVGNGGFFDAFGGGGDCGRISTLSVSATRGQACAAANTSSGGNLRFRGAIIQSVNLNMQSGRVEIIEGASIRVTGMEAA